MKGPYNEVSEIHDSYVRGLEL